MSIDARAGTLVPALTVKENCEHGLEGVVAKRRNGLYRSGHRGWLKRKNPSYWRLEQERASVRRSFERHAVAAYRAPFRSAVT